VVLVIKFLAGLRKVLMLMNFLNTLRAILRANFMTQIYLLACTFLMQEIVRNLLLLL
jgi:hypothetical protein